MPEDPRLAEIAALVGDPARANILTALLDGRALTASELAYFAGVSPQTTSGHLAKLTLSGMLALQKQGRHRYYRLAGPQVARMMPLLPIGRPAGRPHDGGHHASGGGGAGAPSPSLEGR
jgi:DNA-binding transcriptional ArsR family regulator